MCGIVGAVAKNNIVPTLIEGLRRLEYRGYDSAGIALNNGRLHRLRTTGRVAELSKLADEQCFSGDAGIAHTRWATHGAPSERNAHPHFSGETPKVADRKSTRLNSSHGYISYAVFCLKKKKKYRRETKYK